MQRLTEASPLKFIKIVYKALLLYKCHGCSAGNKELRGQCCLLGASNFWAWPIHFKLGAPSKGGEICVLVCDFKIRSERERERKVSSIGTDIL